MFAGLFDQHAGSSASAAEGASWWNAAADKSIATNISVYTAFVFGNSEYIVSRILEQCLEETILVSEQSAR